jgi:hypothetical protein
LSAVNGWVKTCTALSRRPVMRLACTATTVLVCTLLLGSATLSQSDSGSLAVSANDLARRVITNELKFQDDHTNWMYRLEKAEDGKKQAQEIIETKEGSLSRLLSINDQPMREELLNTRMHLITDSSPDRKHLTTKVGVLRRGQIPEGDRTHGKAGARKPHWISWQPHS